MLIDFEPGDYVKNPANKGLGYWTGSINNR